MAPDPAYTASDAHRINFKQDLPPAGGYSKIYWQRTFPRTWVNAKRLAAIAVPYCVYAWYSYTSSKYRLQTLALCESDQRLSMLPFILAERDRKILAQASKLRETEEELMKDVPGWKTGTYYGEPVYYTLGDRWWDLSYTDHFAHSGYHDAESGYIWGQHMEYSGPKWYEKYLPTWVNERFA